MFKHVTPPSPTHECSSGFPRTHQTTTAAAHAATTTFSHTTTTAPTHPNLATSTLSPFQASQPNFAEDLSVQGFFLWHRRTDKTSPPSASWLPSTLPSWSLLLLRSRCAPPGLLNTWCVLIKLSPYHDFWVVVVEHGRMLYRAAMW